MEGVFDVVSFVKVGVDPVYRVLPCGCCDVHFGLGLICMQYLGVEEKRNGLVNLVQRGTS